MMLSTLFLASLPILVPLQATKGTNNQIAQYHADINLGRVLLTFEQPYQLRIALETKSSKRVQYKYLLESDESQPQLIHLGNRYVLSSRSQIGAGSHSQTTRYFCEIKKATVHCLGGLIESIVKKGANHTILGADYSLHRKFHLHPSKDGVVVTASVTRRHSDFKQTAQWIELYEIRDEGVGPKLRLVKTFGHKAISWTAAEELFDTFIRAYYEAIKTKAKLDYPVEETAARFEFLSQLRPDFAPAYYNRACMLALSTITINTKQALEQLRIAVSLDSEYRSKARRDKDLVSLRKLPEFKRMMRKRPKPQE